MQLTIGVAAELQDDLAVKVRLLNECMSDKAGLGEVIYKTPSIWPIATSRGLRR